VGLVRVLAACSLGGAGHLQPLLPLLDAARRRSHETLVVGPPALRGMVNASGHAFAAGGEPPEAAVAPIRERLPVVPAREASVLGNRELFGRLATTAMLPAMDRVVARWQPHIVLRDPCEYASAVIAHPLGVASVQVAIGLAEVEWGSISSASPALEAHRPGLTVELHRSPYVTRFPASADPSPFPDTRRFREPAPATLGSLPDWWNGSSAPLVYVTFGTVLGHMSTAAEAYRTAIQAVAGIDARVLLTVGRRFDASQLGRIPGNIHVESWVDQADVLHEADVVVCHGGSGTTFGALAAGVPVVIVPQFADQFANGTKVAEAGAGIVLDRGQDSNGCRRPLGQDDAPRIAEAIETIRVRPSYREHARLIAAEMASAATTDTLLDELVATR
jgi:UDP:flavonoid glycosyltransferase YjiC (YdhE family)